MKINGEVIVRLAELYSDKRISQKILFDTLRALPEFCSAAYLLKQRGMIFAPETMGSSEYEIMMASAQRNYENAKCGLLSALNSLNRMSDRAGLSPVYSGTLSGDADTFVEISASVAEYCGAVGVN